MYGDKYNMHMIDKAGSRLKGDKGEIKTFKLRSQNWVCMGKFF
jgi:hypothetical protein